jgi:hypothetical protein
MPSCMWSEVGFGSRFCARPALRRRPKRRTKRRAWPMLPVHMAPMSRTRLGYVGTGFSSNHAKNRKKTHPQDARLEPSAGPPLRLIETLAVFIARHQPGHTDDDISPPIPGEWIEEGGDESIIETRCPKGGCETMAAWGGFLLSY